MNKTKKIGNILVIALLIASFVLSSSLSYIAIKNYNNNAFAKQKKVKVEKGKKKYVFTQKKNKKIIALRSRNKKVAKAVKIKKKGKVKVYIKGVRVGTTAVSVHYRNKKGKRVIKEYSVKVIKKKKVASTPSPKTTATPKVMPTTQPAVSSTPAMQETPSPVSSSKPYVAPTNNPESPYYYKFKIINSGKYHLYTTQHIYFMLESNDPNFFTYRLRIVNKDTSEIDGGADIVKNNFAKEEGVLRTFGYFDNLIADSDYYNNNGKRLDYIYVETPGIKIPTLIDRSDGSTVYTFPSIEIYDYKLAEKKWLKETAASLTNDAMTKKEKATALCDYVHNNFDYQYHDDNGNVHILNDQDPLVFMHPSIDCWGANSILCMLLKEVGIEAEGIFNDPDNSWHENTLVTYSDGTTEVLHAQPSTLTGSLTKHDTYYEFDYKKDENGNKLRIEFVDPLTAPAYEYTGDGVY